MKRFAFWILHSKETQHAEAFGVLLINLEFRIQMESFAFWILHSKETQHAEGTFDKPGIYNPHGKVCILDFACGKTEVAPSSLR